MIVVHRKLKEQDPSPLPSPRVQGEGRSVLRGRIQLDGPGWPAPASISATQILRCDPPDYRPVLTTTDGPAKTWADPLAALDWLSRDQSKNWYGYLSYDLGRWFENLPTAAIDDRRLPLFAFAAGNAIEAITPSDSPAAQTVAMPTVSRNEYERQITRCLEYIAAGDVFQINLSQRFSVQVSETSDSIYARLTLRTPAQFGALLDFGDFQLLSNSPELFLEQDSNRNIRTRPIKGTRPTSNSSPAAIGNLCMFDVHSTGNLRSSDGASAGNLVTAAGAHLLASAKDAAELNMIIDLERNDLGRVCEIGSVRVTQPRTIESHPTVVHGVATIEGKLRDETTFLDLLRATFPGGSVTGAPKIRAMQIIDELEPFQRGPYCGAIGVIRPDGSHTFNLAIRTIVLQNGRADVQVGGGIVADSTVVSEYEETLVKTRALFHALNISEVSQVR